ncbi:MAG: dihydrolipoyl dehydrogenase [Nitrospiria bacterium]
MEKEYDLLILGGGPGGYVAAIRAGQLGMKVAVIEKEAVGGTCLHHGCIPSKAIIRNAEVLSLIRESEKFGIQVENVRADFGAAIDRSQEVLNKLHKGVTHLVKKQGVEIHAGFGKLTAPNTIEVKGEGGTWTLRGKSIVISTGSRVRGLPHLQIDGKRIITSDEALLRRELPKSVLIVGGGAIGCEFAYIYSAYGVPVTIVEILPNLLPLEDVEVSKLLERSFKKRKIDILTNTAVASAKDQDGVFEIEVKPSKGETETREAEVILVAVGRAPNVDGIGLETVGVAVDEKTKLIQVDEGMRTNKSNIFAIGDVCSRPALAHGAMAQGVFVVETLAGIERTPIELQSVPSAVYCHPQVASIGLTEAKAKEAGYAVKVAKFPLSANGKALALGEPEGFVKIVTDEKYGEILGAHIIGAEATELIGEFVLAQTLESTGAELKLSIHPHPTLSEAVMEAGGALFGEAIHS